VCDARRWARLRSVSSTYFRARPRRLSARSAARIPTRRAGVPGPPPSAGRGRVVSSASRSGGRGMPAAWSWPRACLAAWSVSFARAVLPMGWPASARLMVRCDTPAPAAVCWTGSLRSLRTVSCQSGVAAGLAVLVEHVVDTSRRILLGARERPGRRGSGAIPTIGMSPERSRPGRSRPQRSNRPRAHVDSARACLPLEAERIQCGDSLVAQLAGLPFVAAVAAPRAEFDAGRGHVTARHVGVAMLGRVGR
jgi:hypothetical protein